MNIVILQGAFFPVPPALGGAVEKMWFKLGIEFAKQGHQVTHISKSYINYPNQEMISGVSHVRVKGYSAPKSIVKLKILDAIYSWKALKTLPRSVDIIITNSFWAPILLHFKKVSHSLCGCR